MEDGGAVGKGAGNTVPGVALTSDEVLGSFALLQQLGGWHPQQFYDAGQLVRLILPKHTQLTLPLYNDVHRTQEHF